MPNKITTFTNIRMNPLNPKKSDIEIQDIAHALSLMTRGNGQIRYFFSVGQHSLNCYKEARARNYSLPVQLGALIHDASESYLSDITRPVKKELIEYQVIEKRLQDLIYAKYLNRELSEDECSQIKDIDNAMLEFELNNLFNVKNDNKSQLLSKPSIELKDMKEVEDEFLNVFNELMSLINKV